MNITGEESKHGFRKEDVLPFIQELADLDKIQIVGLMTMAPFGASEEVLHATFRELKELQMTVNEKHLSFAPCTELSMGMSNDFPIAVEEGATLYESEQRYSEMRKGEEFMSIFNKDALSSFLAYLAKKMIIMITTKNMKSAKQLMNHRVVQLGLNHNALFNNRKVTISQLIHNKVSL